MWCPDCGADIVHDFHRMAAVVYYHRPRKAPPFRTEIEEVGGEAATDGVPFECLLSILYILSQRKPTTTRQRTRKAAPVA
jgi:hypothetical protein